MTEISAKRLFKNGGNKHVFCAVDNHNLKNTVTYTILYTAKTKKELIGYMIEKGIWD